MCKYALYLLSVVAISLSTATVATQAPLLPAKAIKYQASYTATHSQPVDRQALQHPLPTLTIEERMSFQLGKSLFNKIWVSSPSSTTASDGLGPLFNARNCSSCHINNGRGQPAVDESIPKNNLSSVMRLSIPASNNSQRELLRSGRVASIDEPTYGAQLQDMSISGVPAEGLFSTRYTTQLFTFPDGEVVELQKPDYQFHKLNYGELSSKTQHSLRIAPPIIGLGLLEQIADQQIEALADPFDLNKDGISGKPNYVWNLETQTKDLGRFGWKAKHPSLAQQNSQALSQDIGLSSHLFPAGYGGCTEQQTACRKAPDGNREQHDNVEVSNDMLHFINFYTQSLAITPARNQDSPAFKRGEKLFHQSGCAQCHTPSFTLDIPNAQPVTLSPYSDLLLHDMGEGLADSVVEFLASGSEWRTPPLWSIGLTQLINPQARFLHDGRARNLTEAILWHAGEADTAKEKFIHLDQQQRRDLILFLESI